MAKGPRRGSRPEDPHGVCVVDKPAGWTSHDVVARTRSILGTPKVGHAGTLDPMATGVLVLGVGRATRLLRFVTDGTKEYSAQITFGTETSTLDAEGEVTVTHEMADLSVERVRKVAAELTGDILQVPPMVSAIKVDGKRLHQLAREGIEIERQARPVTVSRFDVEPTDDPLVWNAHVSCSSGTYVRSLAADLGRHLGGGAHLSGLRRTAVGAFRIDDAHPVESPELLTVEAALRSLERVVADDALAGRVRQGAVLEASELGAGDAGPWAVFSRAGEPLAVYEPFRPGLVKPLMVLATEAFG